MRLTLLTVNGREMERTLPVVWEGLGLAGFLGFEKGLVRVATGMIVGQTESSGVNGCGR